MNAEWKGNNVISGNTATSYGGGVATESGAGLTITDTAIESNTATSYYGGGVFAEGAAFTIRRSKIRGNSAGSHGGGVSTIRTGTIENTIISGNKVTGGENMGGGIYSTNTLAVTNCTIAANYASSSGSGIYGNAAATVKNSIFWGNTGGSQVYQAASVTYSDVEGGGTTNGNINSNPLFIDNQTAAGTPNVLGDYHLCNGNNDPVGSTCTNSSPCKNVGNNADAPAGTDIDGDNRIINVTVDMGADEKLLTITN